MALRILIARSAAAALTIGALALAPAVYQGTTTDATAAADAPFATLAWEHALTSTSPVWFGSPGAGDLDGQGTSVIIGDRSGRIYAFHTSDGTAVSGWPYRATASIMSTPSVLGSGSGALLFFGIGESPSPRNGGYLALHADGTKAWFKQPYLLPGNKGGTRGVMSSLSVGHLRTAADVVGGAMGQMQWAMTADTGTTLKGFPWLMADTNFTTPAIAPILGDGRNYIVEGGDSTAGRAYYQYYTNGGHIRIIQPSGWTGKHSPNDGLVCQFNTTQVVQSSPAVGGFLASGAMGVVVGTGHFYKNSNYTNKIVAINSSCKKIWTALLDGDTTTSPALADLTGDGTLEVVMNSTKGTVYAYNGATGALIWKNTLGSGTNGSVVTFQSPTGNFQYVLAPTGNGLYILDGRDGSIVQQIATDLRLKSGATVTVDPSGEIGITVAGPLAASGKIEHYTVTGSSVASVQTPGAWPMFHHDPQLTGFAPAPTP